MNFTPKTIRTNVATAALLALAIGAPACTSDSTDTTPTQVEDRSAELRTQMRQLWETHVQWTRMVIISFAAGLPDFEAAVNRLQQNQDDIGDAIKPFYGDQAGDQLASLLHDHISIAAEVLQAAKSGDQQALGDASDRWYANGQQIADFLSAANPDNWPQADMRAAMKEHLDTTIDEATARLTGDWEQDVVAYDAARDHVLMMADTLSSGIVAQFPDRFTGNSNQDGTDSSGDRSGY